MNCRPFLKWAGGKGSSLEQFKDYYPRQLSLSEIENYVEPFVGGGAVFFDLIQKYNFKKIILNDITDELILTYRVVQNNVEALISKLTLKEKQYLKKKQTQREDYYYKIRDKFNKQKKTIKYETYSEKWVDFAANLIFLNRTCFNGLYRLNSSGEYNVPIGDYKNPTICDSENLIQVSSLLQGVNLISVDFEKTLDCFTDLEPSKTFIYIDPPYRPLPNSKSFTSYAKSAFNDNSQIRLSEWYKKLAENGFLLMLSNSDPTQIDPEDKFFERIYEGFKISKVSAPRAINSKANARNAINEIVVTNY